VILGETKPEKLRVYVHSFLEEVGALAVGQLDSLLRRATLPAMLSTPLDVYDDNLVNDEKVKKARLRRLQPGRIAKYKGDVCLLCGSHEDAQRFYKLAFHATQQNNDWVWNASSIEGQSFASVAREYQDSRETQRKPQFLPEVVDSYFEVFSAYSRHRPYTAPLAIEAVMRLLSYVPKYDMHDLAYEMIGDVAEIATDCSGREQLKVLMELAVLSESLSLKRRAALFLFEAALFFRELNQHENAKRIILESLPLFGVPLLGLPAAQTSTSSLSSLSLGSSSGYGSRAEERLLQARQRSRQLRQGLTAPHSAPSPTPSPPVWLELHCEVFVSLAHSCSNSREPDPWLSAAVITTFLRLYHPWLNISRQITLKDALESCCQSTAMPVDSRMELVGIPEVRWLRLVQGCEAPVRKEVPEGKGFSTADHSPSLSGANSPGTSSSIQSGAASPSVFLFAPKLSKHQRTSSSNSQTFFSKQRQRSQPPLGAPTAPVSAGETLFFDAAFSNPLEVDVVLQAVCVRCTYFNPRDGSESVLLGIDTAVPLKRLARNVIVRLALSVPSNSTSAGEGALRVDGLCINVFNLRSFYPVNEQGYGRQPPHLSDFSVQCIYDQYKARSSSSSATRVENRLLAFCDYPLRFFDLSSSSSPPSSFSTAESEQEPPWLSRIPVIPAVPMVRVAQVLVDGRTCDCAQLQRGSVALSAIEGQLRTISIRLQNTGGVDANHVDVTLVPLWSGSMHVESEHAAIELREAMFGSQATLEAACAGGIAVGKSCELSLPVRIRKECIGITIVVAYSECSHAAWHRKMRMHFTWTPACLKLETTTEQNLILHEENVLARRAEVSDAWNTYTNAPLFVARVRNDHSDAFQVWCDRLHVLVPPRSVVDCAFPLPLVDERALSWRTITADEECGVFAPLVHRGDSGDALQGVQWQCRVLSRDEHCPVRVGQGEKIAIEAHARVEGKLTGQIQAELVCLYTAEERGGPPVAYATPLLSNLEGSAAWHGALQWYFDAAPSTEHRHSVEFAAIRPGTFSFFVRWSERGEQEQPQVSVTPLLLGLVSEVRV
jgi:hypothetical protein